MEQSPTGRFLAKPFIRVGGALEQYGQMQGYEDKS